MDVISVCTRLNLLLMKMGMFSLMSCAPLHKSQVKLTSNYTETLSHYSQHYRTLNQNVAQLSMKVKTLESAVESMDQNKVLSLISAIELYQAEWELTDSLVQHLKVIDDFVQGYYALIPNGFDIYKVVKGTSQTLGGIVGLGGTVSSVLPEGEIRITTVRKKRIKRYFESNLISINRSLESLKTIVDNYYVKRLDSLLLNSQTGFETLFSEAEMSSTSLDYYLNHNPVVLEFYEDLFSTRQSANYIETVSGLLVEGSGQVQKKLLIRQKLASDILILSRILELNNKIYLLTDQ